MARTFRPAIPALMTRANTARHAGDVFQARMFWLQAINLLKPNNPVVRVAWESGPRGFDDIRVEYAPPWRSNNGPVHRQHIQCKWHVDAGEFGYEQLTKPEFINASQHSWLSRAHDAYQQMGDHGVRFALKTNWRIKSDDPLFELKRSESNELNIKTLFTGKTPRSRMGAVRQCWCDHLGIDDDALAPFAATLSICDNVWSMGEIRERMDDRLASAGLRGVPVSQSGYLYDDLVLKLHNEGDVDLDETGLREICDREGLWDSAAVEEPFTLGIRSFMHKFDDLEQRCDALLDLVPFFDGRFLREGQEWTKDLLPTINEFVTRHATEHNALRLRVDAHASIAFAIGRLLNVKSGRSIEIEQRVANDGIQYWRSKEEPQSPRLTVNFNGGGGEDLVIALSLVHDVTQATEGYCGKHITHGYKWLGVQPQTGPSGLSVRDGAHAWGIAVSVAAEVKTHLTPSVRNIHLFAAAPNSVLFFLGQQLGIGSITTYEFDFSHERGGSYHAAWSIGDG